MSASAIGWQVTLTYCRSCAPEGLREGYEPMREGDDDGVPFSCDTCGEKLVPCVHQWSEWGPWFEGGEWRHCTQDHCDAMEQREAVTR